MAETDFPDDFKGAGPMYAAIPLGTAWLDAATRGATTYVLDEPCTRQDPSATGEAAFAPYQAYAGYSAFLDRGQAEVISDARGDGTFTRWDGLSGYLDWSAKADVEFRAADAAMDALLDGLPEAGS